MKDLTADHAADPANAEGGQLEELERSGDSWRILPASKLPEGKWIRIRKIQEEG